MNYIGITSTGKLHICGGPRAAACNSRNNGLANRPAAAATIEAAGHERFCSKCFPEGKETARRVQEYWKSKEA